MIEYKLQRTWAWVTFLIAPPLIVVFAGLASSPLWAAKGVALLWLFVPVALVMIALLVIGFIDAIIGRIQIDTEKIRTVSITGNRELHFNEIRGFRQNQNYIIIEPLDERRKKLKISKYFTGTDNMLALVEARFPDLDALSLWHETTDILHNDAFGATEDERAHNLKRAKTMATVLNWGGCIAGGVAILLATPYELSMLACLVIPILCVLVPFLSKGLVRVVERKGSAYPAVTLGFAVASCGLLIRGISDFHVLEHNSAWSIAGVLCAVLFVAILLRFTEFKRLMSYVELAVMLLFCLCYGYGAMLFVNGYYDKSPTEVYPVEVLAKRVSSGKSKTCHFKLTPCPKWNEPTEIQVARDVYNNYNVGDQVHVYAKAGLLGVPWCVVE